MLTSDIKYGLIGCLLFCCHFRTGQQSCDYSMVHGKKEPDGAAHFYCCCDPWGFEKVGFDFQRDLHPGDLLFQDLDCGPLCDAIEAVTEGAGGRDFSHVGIVAAFGDTLAVVEAIGEKVQKNSVAAFLSEAGKWRLAG